LPQKSTPLRSKRRSYAGQAKGFHRGGRRERREYRKPRIGTDFHGVFLTLIYPPKGEVSPKADTGLTPPFSKEVKNFRKSFPDKGLGSFSHFCKLALFFRVLRAVSVS